MKTQTKVLDLQKLLAKLTAEESAITKRQQAQAALDAVISGNGCTPGAIHLTGLIDPCVLSAARQAKQASDTAKQTFDSLPKPRQELAKIVHKTAMEIAIAAARKMGGLYSGHVSHDASWGTSATAFTSVSSGDQYSRSCKYSKNDAMHFVWLDPARVHTLVESGRLCELSNRDGLPLIALDDDGAAVWVKSSNKQITEQAGWVIGCDRCCYHSTKSREDAVKGHAKKLAAIIENERRQAEYEKARKASPEYKAERRARLIARLCGNVTATIADAKACGYCTPGIEQFQRTHGIGDTASLPALVKTGNSMAISLALRLARKVKQAA